MLKKRPANNSTPADKRRLAIFSTQTQESSLATNRIITSARLVRDVESFCTRFVVLPGGVSLPLALWILATYLHKDFDALAYLAVLSPVKRCGKTRLTEIVELLASDEREAVRERMDFVDAESCHKFSWM